MRVQPKKILHILLHWAIGYLVIHTIVSVTEKRERVRAARFEEDWGELPEDRRMEVPDQTEMLEERSDLFTDVWWARMATRQDKRRSTLRNACLHIYNRTIKETSYLAAQKDKLRSLIVNNRHRFIYSIVYKVGSTNWERVIVQDVEGYQNVPNQRLYSHKALEWMQKFSEDKVQKYLEQYTKFIFVRNPLSRILSGYRDKFVDHHNSVFSSLARQIIKQYRNKRSVTSSNAAVTFTEFVSYLTDSAKHRANPHWKPIYTQNMPCEISFNIIGRLEDANDDIPYVLKRVGIWNLTDYGKGPQRQSTDAKLLKQYYSQIPPKLLQDLYRIYEPDFLMFGYDMPLFL